MLEVRRGAGMAEQHPFILVSGRRCYILQAATASRVPLLLDLALEELVEEVFGHVFSAIENTQELSALLAVSSTTKSLLSAWKYYHAPSIEPQVTKARNWKLVSEFAVVLDP